MSGRIVPKKNSFKFRAWDKKNNLIKDVITIYLSENAVELHFQHGENPEYKQFHEVVLMQSTGLKDKNDVEIFEGDIVRYTWDNPRDISATEKGKKFRIAKVFWSDWRASWAVGKKSCNDSLFRFARNGNTVEVIGNIYEDNNLIK